MFQQALQSMLSCAALDVQPSGRGPSYAIATCGFPLHAPQRPGKPESARDSLAPSCQPLATGKARKVWLQPAATTQERSAGGSWKSAPRLTGPGFVLATQTARERCSLSETWSGAYKAPAGSAGISVVRGVRFRGSQARPATSWPGSEPADHALARPAKPRGTRLAARGTGNGHKTPRNAYIM